MKDDFKVSVIIPVYNAAQFLRQSVESALAINEVAEVVLVEDGSPDDALSVCKALCKTSENVKLFRHPNGENRGPGASRNLGIQKSRFEYLSFLDADDYYLPGRFEDSRKIFLAEPQVDFTFGIAQYENEHLKNSKVFKGMQIPENCSRSLFQMLLLRTYGVFHTNTVTVRKESLLRLGALFNTGLQLHQDSELWLRMAYDLKGLSEPGRTPTAIVRQHELNRIIYKNDASVLQFWRTVKRAFKKKPLSFRQRLLIYAYCWQLKPLSRIKFINRLKERGINKGIRYLRSGS